ncbi:MAG: DUF6382 domain-containing protein [Lutisporaceae bacterium]
MNLNSQEYIVTYQNDAIHSYMVLKLKPQDKLIDYQIKIINDNPTQNLLALHRTQFDNEVFIHYDITSKITIEQFLVRRKLSRHEFLSMVKSIIKGLQIGKKYLLKRGKCILNIEYMYINPSSLEVSLAYMPIDLTTDIKEDLRAFLTDLIVYKAVFEHPEEGSFVYRMLNFLKSEEFSLEQLDKLVFAIAVEYEQLKDIKVSTIKSKELASIENNEALSIKTTQDKAKKQQSKASLSKNKLYISMLAQLLFVALALLLLRFMIKQNSNIDIYSIIGVLLLIMSADFLVVRRLGLLEKHEGRGNQQMDSQKRNKEKSTVASDYLKPGVFVDMETSVLGDRGMSYAYLLGCQENSHERIGINKSSFIIGRMKNQVDYVSQNNAVGKVHAEIIIKEGIHYIRDLNSRNGTYVNGERIASNVQHVIKNNDRIAFANSEYMFIWNLFKGDSTDD